MRYQTLPDGTKFEKSNQLPAVLKLFEGQVSFLEPLGGADDAWVRSGRSWEQQLLSGTSPLQGYRGVLRRGALCRHTTGSLMETMHAIECTDTHLRVAKRPSLGI